MTERVIEKQVEFTAPLARVWRALTDSGEIGSWFSDSADFEPVEGYDGSVTWHDHGTFALRVEIVDPPKKLAWRWSHESGVPIDADVATLVEWTLTEREDGGTLLSVRESGFATDERREENEGGWTQELGHLLSFVEPSRGPSLLGNNDVAIHVDDLDAAEAFYVRGLGLPLVARTDGYLEIDAGAFRLWVNQSDGPPGFIPSFDVADRDAALARLRGAGASVSQHGRNSYAADPFGNPIDVVQTG